MNSDVEKMLEMIDRISECQSEANKAKWDYDYSLYDIWVAKEQTAKQDFESALTSLIDDRIKLITGMEE